MVGSALSGLGGVFFAISETVEWDMGFRLLLLLIFAGVILGGIGTAYGAMVGGFGVGLLTELSTYWIDAEFKTAIGLNLQFGYTGLVNLGHIASMLVGAYGTAIVVDAGGSLLLGVLVGLASAVVLGLVWGLPTLRLRADYLAIVTLSGAEILRYVVRSQWADSLTASVYGIQRFADVFYDWNPFGEGSYGFSIALQSLMIGGVIGSLAGAMLAIETQNVHPDFYIPVFGMFVFAVVLLGGPGTIWGPVVGSILFWLLFEWFDGFIVAAIGEGWFGNLLTDIDAGPLRTVLLGAGLILLVVFRPQGLLGNREEVLLDDR